MKAQAKPQALPCFAHRHMTGNEYALYDVARSKSKKTGILIFSSRQMANDFEGMSKSTAHRIAQSLIDKGWFIPDESLVGNKPSGTSARYRVLSHEQWAANHPDQCRSNEDQVSHQRDSSVPPAGHPNQNEVSQKQGVVSQIRGEVSQIRGEVSQNKGQVSHDKHVTVTHHNGIDAPTYITSIRQPILTSSNLCPPGSDFADEFSNAGQDVDAQAVTGSAPVSVPPAGHPIPAVTGSAPFPPDAGMVWSDEWLDLKTSGRLSDSAVVERLARVGLKQKPTGTIMEHVEVATGSPVDWVEAHRRITGKPWHVRTAKQMEVSANG